MTNKMNIRPYKNPEIVTVVGTMYGKYGSIKECKTIEDFGLYRARLVQLFDKEITKIKRDRNKDRGKKRC